MTGNPRVSNTSSFLSKLQAIEFASIISLLRRAQRVWGRIMTMSGVVGIFRRSALMDVGLYRPQHRWAFEGSITIEAPAPRAELDLGEESGG